MLDKLKQYNFKQYNIPLLIVVLILSSIGVFLISKVQAADESLVVRQILGLVGGLVIALVVSLIDYHFIASFYIIMYIINLVLLILVKSSFGVTINYAQRWINLFGIQFQPSELTKIILILFAAKVFTLAKAKINNFLVLTLITVSIAIPTFLILIQTNLSTSMVIMFIFVMMVFAAGLSWKIIVPIIVIGVPCVLGLFWYVQQDYQILLKDYQQERVLSYINPEEYAETMFQQDNSKIAIGSGQLIGKVFASDNSTVRNYDDVPISESDFIFSVAGEEFGFIGGFVIISLFAVIIYICLMTAKKAPDYMGMLIAVGIASMFMFQVFVNIGVATSILPNTGIPLPFVSYGLSSFISGMLAIGLILNIGLQPMRTRIQQ
ncbi:MAG: FtsW/RodA/SpoVE family cell cycle protein [Mobilitalea sp.]